MKEHVGGQDDLRPKKKDDGMRPSEVVGKLSEAKEGRVGPFTAQALLQCCIMALNPRWTPIFPTPLCLPVPKLDILVNKVTVQVVSCCCVSFEPCSALSVRPVSRRSHDSTAASPHSTTPWRPYALGLFRVSTDDIGCDLSEPSRAFLYSSRIRQETLWP